MKVDCYKEKSAWCWNFNSITLSFHRSLWTNRNYKKTTNSFLKIYKFYKISFLFLCMAWYLRILWDFEIYFCKIYICSAYAICAYLKTYSQLVPRLVTVALLFGKINKHFKSDSYDLLKTCLLESNLKKIPSSSRNELSNYICAAIIRYATALWLWVGNHSYIT